jgi:peptide/nickel transport system substrate-binding protein
MSGQFEAAILGGMTDPEPSVLISPYFDSAGPGNNSGYSNPRLDYVLKNGLEASSHGARGINYRVAQQIIQDDRPIIVLYARPFFLAFDASLLTGVQLTAVGSYSLANAQFIK